MLQSSEVRKAIRTGALITGASIFFSVVPVWIWLQIDPVIDAPSIYISCVVLPGLIAPTCSWAILNARIKAERLARENHRLANEDELTGLPNRRAFFASASVLQMQPDTGQGRFYCAIADVDNFKRVNDVYGHDVGDTVLISVASVLRDAASEKLRVARLGGEEFALAGVFSTDDEARAAFESIVTAVRCSDWRGLGLTQATTISLGYCRDTGEAGISVLLSHADEALYRAKDAGKNRAVCHGEAAFGVAA